MITNLPNKLNVRIANEFSFGDAEARADKLLTKCHVPTAALNELIQDQKDIILGHRGTGKSAIVRLLDERLFKFKSTDGAKSEVLILDEEFDYNSIKNHLSKHALKDQEPSLVCRAVWEILVIYRLIEKTRSLLQEKDETLEDFFQEIELLIGTSTKKRVSLVEILLSHKKKVGIKFDTYHPNIVDSYIGLEPSSDSASSQTTTVLKVGEYRRFLDKLLKEKNIRIYVLFDRLDDFVIREEYETQKLLLQELLSTQQIYREKSQNIRVKAFFRTDLFERLNLAQFGPDKILSRCINISWTPSDIKRFIAQRVGYNLLQCLSLPGFEVRADKDRFFISRDELSMLEESKSMTSFNPFKKSHWQRVLFLAGIELRKKERNTGRLTDSMEVIHEELVTSVFPRQVLHRRQTGEIVEMDIFKFLDTHLQFANGETTPRAVLSFLDRCLEKIRDYYLQNGDIGEIDKDQNGEFPLFVKIAISRAYADFRKTSWKIQYQLSKEWTEFVAVVETFSTKGKFTYEEFKRSAKDQDAEIRQFLAFSSHTGLIHCENSHAKEGLQNPKPFCLADGVQ